MVKIDKIKKLVEDMRDYLQSHFDFKDSREVDVILCWILGTYCKCFDSYPRLIFMGPKQSGKSKVMDFLSETCCRAENSVIPSPAAIFRIIDLTSPTLLVDEFNLEDVKQMPEVIAMYRKGYKKRATILRCGSPQENYKPKHFDIFCPVALAGLNFNDDQLLDRSIVIHMMKTFNSKIACSKVDIDWFNRSKVLYWKIFPKGLEKFETQELVDINRELDDTLWNSGRQGELWQPLFAIAKYLEDVLKIEIFGNISTYCHQSTKVKAKHDRNSLDNKLVEKIGVLDDMKSFTVAQLVSLMNDEGDDYRDRSSSTKIGSVLTRLDIKFRILSGTKFFNISDDEYKILRKQFNLEDVK